MVPPYQRASGPAPRGPPRLGSAVPVAPTQPFVMTDADWERLPLRGVLGFTEEQLR